MQVVEQLEQRVNGLHALTVDVDQKIGEQVARRAELDGVKNQCDTLLTQLLDAQQKLDGVTRCGRACCRWRAGATLLQGVERCQQLVRKVKTDESAVHQQRAQLLELVEQSKTLSAESAERLQQARGVSADLDRATALKRRCSPNWRTCRPPSATRWRRRWRPKTDPARRGNGPAARSALRAGVERSGESGCAGRRGSAMLDRVADGWSKRSACWATGRRWCRR